MLLFDQDFCSHGGYAGEPTAIAMPRHKSRKFTNSFFSMSHDCENVQSLSALKGRIKPQRTGEAIRRVAEHEEC